MACIKYRRRRWVVDFRDQQGQRRWETSATRDEANAALARRIKEVQQQSYRPPEELPTFGEVAAAWLDAKRDRRPSSVGPWRGHLRHARLDAVRIDRVTVEQLEALRSALRDRGLAPQTANKILTTIAAVFGFREEAPLRPLEPRRPGGAGSLQHPRRCDRPG